MSNKNWRSKKWIDFSKREKLTTTALAVVAVAFIVMGAIYRIVHIPDWLWIAVAVVAVALVYQAAQSFPYLFNHDYDDEDDEEEDDD